MAALAVTALLKSEAPANVVMVCPSMRKETLLEGPDAGSNLVAAVPSGTQLLDINVKPDEKKCIVDFSQELRNQLASNGNSEELAIYSPVFPDLHRRNRDSRSLPAPRHP